MSHQPDSLGEGLEMLEHEMNRQLERKNLLEDALEKLRELHSTEGVEVTAKMLHEEVHFTVISPELFDILEDLVDNCPSARHEVTYYTDGEYYETSVAYSLEN